MAKYVYKGRTVTGGNGEGQALKADAFYPLVSIGKKELKTGLNGNWLNSDPAIGAVS